MGTRIDRRRFVRAIGIGGMAAAMAEAGSAAETALPGVPDIAAQRSREATVQGRGPNIVFLMADDLGYGDLGCYGATRIPTPVINRVASQGVRFTDAHTPSGVCSPTRYGVLTGRYCWRSRLKNGVLNGYSPALIEPGRMTVASMLRARGYATACVGKWHLGFGDADPVDYEKPLRPGPLDVGFDYFFGIPASLDMPPYCFVENDRSVGVPSVEKDVYHAVQRKGLMTPGWKDEEVGPSFAQKAIAWLERTAGESPKRPFFLYYASHAPHTPCTPPDFIRGRSQAGPRGDMVAEFDWTAGQLLAALDRLGLADNTLFIVTSDNGALTTGPAAWDKRPPEEFDLVHNGHRSNGALRGQKSDAYEGGHRVPYLARWPGKIKAATTCAEPICHVDLMATCAAITGAELPNDAAEDSFNILPALLGEKRDRPIHEAIVHHSGNGVFAIRQGKWKLIEGLGSGGFTAPAKVKAKPGDPEGQLYDLEADPAESRNVWKENPEIVARLTALLDTYRNQGHSRPMQPSS
jgi:arylsulfatase A-like enzyme